MPWNFSDAPAPSVFGALPTVTTGCRLPPSSDFVVYHITSFNPNVMNSSVVGPGSQSHTAFRIITDPLQPQRTIWRDSHRRTVAIVDWSARSVVEMPGLIPRQSVRSWLRLSSDRTSRHMEVRGVHYVWAPVDHFICLYDMHGGASRIIARVSSLSSSVGVELTQRALQYGLLDVCILCASIFLSGQNID
ncbi:hypothetical protein EW146_g346 [Bondarzewia mesenterica]|uniref:Uncharacterized protein n=1 Tax=Bondarzewia mesenterica TaxID=1095465 RepID=A0A4S4M8U2_9AGAM|nr:hypothetical protein EW146_g346 [Bondarzewia mesenterica]